MTGPYRSVAGVVPGPTKADGDVERDVERVGSAHLPADQILDRLALPHRHLENELVVHLQEQPGAQAAVAQPTLHAEHRDLDDVRRTALDGRVERHALRHLPALTVVTGEVRQVA